METVESAARGRARAPGCGTPAKPTLTCEAAPGRHGRSGLLREALEDAPAILVIAVAILFVVLA